MTHRILIIAYDVGAIILPNAFAGPPGNFGCTRVPSDSELDSLLVALLGYPVGVAPQTMWGDQGFLIGVSPIQIYYDIETEGGMSGGPVFYTEGDLRYIVGIHNYGGSSLGNYATRLTEPIKGAIESWEQMAQAALNS